MMNFNSFKSLKESISALTNILNHFIITKKQRNDFWQSEEGKVINEESFAWKDGYKKGYEDCRRRTINPEELKYDQGFNDGVKAQREAEFWIGS